MMTKVKVALAAALVLGSASAALAQAGDELQRTKYEGNPNAMVKIFARQAQAMAALVEGRNVALRASPGSVATNDTFEPFPSFGGY